MKEKMKFSVKVMHWLPRILCIFAILFISLFAADSFSSDLTFWQKIFSFLIHLIPTFVMIILLIISWKRDLFGSISFILVGIVFIPIVYSMNYNLNQSVAASLGAMAGITLPFILVGILFWTSYLKKKNEKVKQGSNKTESQN